MSASNEKPVVKSGETVSVGCKMPNGLILRLQVLQEIDYPIMGGGVKKVKEWRWNASAPTFTLLGNRIRAPEGEEQPLLIGGFAITHNIPKDFWEEWLSQNKDLELVKNGLVVAHEKMDHVRGQADDFKLKRSGLEPLKPGNDARIPKRSNPDTGKLEDAITTGTRA